MAKEGASKFSVFFALTLVIGTIAGLIWGVGAIWNALASVDTRLAASLIAGSTTVLVATLSVVLGKYYERQKEIESHFRETKSEMYDEFIKEIFGLFTSDNCDNESDDLIPMLREWQRKLVVWGGPKVMTTYIAWKNHLATSNPNAESVFLMGDFLLSVRKGLGLSNRGLDRGSFAHLVLKNAGLLLQMAAQNPSVTLNELAEKERELGLEAD